MQILVMQIAGIFTNKDLASLKSEEVHCFRRKYCFSSEATM